MRMPEMLDNVSRTVKEDLAVTIAKGDKLSIAAACFSIYAYQARTMYPLWFCRLGGTCNLLQELRLCAFC